MTTTSDRRFLTTGQAAARLRVAPTTVQRYAARGQLAYLRTLGGHRRFDPATVDQLAAHLGRPATGTGEDPDRADSNGRAGRAVALQLAVAGWAVTRRPASTGAPDDPCDPAA